MGVCSRIGFGFCIFLMLFGQGSPATGGNALRGDAHEKPLQRIGDGHGTLVLIGGALAVNNQEIYDALKRSLDRDAPGTTPARPPRIAFIPSSKADLHSAWSDFFLDDPAEPASSPAYRTWFSRAGFVPILIPVTVETILGPDSIAESRHYADLIRSCEMVFLQGGDQARHVQCLRRTDGSETPLLQAIRDVYAAGGVIIGTSAGTHALADPMYGWGESGPALRHGRLDLWKLAELDPIQELEPRQSGNSLRMPGLGLLPAGILTDTHFDARGRLGRLIVGVRDCSARWGIGVDENTALFLESGIGTVYGEHGVFLLDTASATFSQPGSPLQADGLRLSYLTSGDRWDIRDGVVHPASGSTSSAVPSGVARSAEDPFSEETGTDGERRNPYGATRLLQALAAENLDSIRADSHPPHPCFRLQFRRSPATEIFWQTPQKFTVSRLELSIVPKE